MQSISAYFYGSPGSPLDRACQSIFASVEGAKHIGSGTMLVGNRAGERDVQYHIPDDKADEVRAALKKAGFRLEPTPMGDVDLSGAEGVPAVSGPDIEAFLREPLQVPEPEDGNVVHPDFITRRFMERK
jgi:hypothetical protein